MMTGQAVPPSLWLTQTKLQPPRLRADLLARQGLLDMLHGAVSSLRLTLVSAPAGYGKTTLLAGLAHAFPELPLAWLSLDRADNDPSQFLSALVAALQRLNPACGLTAQTVLAGLGQPRADIQRVMGVLINDILAISTRHDPPLALARLRSRGELAELRLAELRFTLAETTALLNEQLRLGLSAADLALLYRRTEGWAAGLRLLAGSLQPLPPFSQRSAFIARLVQSNRYIFDLLAEEVLRQHPGHVFNICFPRRVRAVL